MTELSENELITLLSKSKEVILEFISNHPDFFYKGIPVVLVVYMVYPFIFTFWTWLPWIWASYQTYQILPKGTFSLISGLLKDQTWIIEYLQS